MKATKRKIYLHHPKGFKAGIKQAVKEIKLVKDGKLKALKAEDLLIEL